MKPRVIAHRGASGELPENTLPAYALAVAQGADMIEIDLHRTRDGVIVVAHDETLEKLGGRGEIADATLDEVRALDAGGGQPVPILDEVLDGFGARIPFNLELKQGGSGDYPGLESQVVEAVGGRDLLPQMLFSSFSDTVLARLRELAPDARLGCLVSARAPERAFERARAVGAEALNPWFGLVTEDLVREAHAEGMAVYAYTVDEADQMRRLLDLGVDGLFTNRPARLRSVVDSPGG